MEDSIRSLERSIEKHEVASSALLSCLSDSKPEEVAKLIDDEYQARKRALLWAADLAEKCLPSDEIFFLGHCNKLKLHMENWEVSEAEVEWVIARVKGE